MRCLTGDPKRLGDLRKGPAGGQGPFNGRVLYAISKTPQGSHGC
jgi:hypothetical protein